MKMEYGNDFSAGEGPSSLEPFMKIKGEQCLGMLPRARGIGGMVSFQAKLEQGLAQRGIRVTYDLERDPCDSVLVVGGTRQIRLLRKLRRKGAPIFQRLDGINWIHRRRRTGVRHFLRAEIANWILSSIRTRWASGIIYQSHFVVDWWEAKYGVTRLPKWVIHNGVDLDHYTPDGPHERPEDHIRVLIVEGSLGGGYELGLTHAITFCERLEASLEKSVELMVVGSVEESTRREAAERTTLRLNWVGRVPGEQIPTLDRSAHLFFAADIHPACPNAVIEALACGLPVVAFDTGALGELVLEGSGQLVAYGGDPWKLERPDFDSLAQAAVAVVRDQPGYRARARAHAEHRLGLDSMIDAYLDALGWLDTLV
jgi:glycosyltransferase involved in cell wall biosynthesis